MEKQAKTKNNSSILKYLPRAASAVVNFQNPPFSPGRENNLKLKAYAGKGFSGPIVSIIPDEVRRKPKNESYETREEPTSPKISCMGQIKHKKKMKKLANDKKPPKPDRETDNKPAAARDLKKHASAIKRLFSSSKLGARRSDASVSDAPTTSLGERPPSLGQMKRFASGRDSLANFEWTSQIAPGFYSSNEEKRDSDQDDQDEDDYIIHFSAPINIDRGVVDLQPRKEVNLWKRRTMNPPRPLQLND